MQDHPLLAPAPLKKRGRPPGSKNKKTMEAMQIKAEGSVEPVMQAPAAVPEEAVSVAAAASGLLQGTPSKDMHRTALQTVSQRGMGSFLFLAS